MSPKPRKKENQGLPARWRFKHGAYYYRVPEGHSELWDGKTEFRLGTTLPDAYREWSERLQNQADAKTVGDLLDRYALEVVPLKAPKSQESNQFSIKKLRPVFGTMLITAVKPKHVFRYRDLRSKEGRTAANRDLEVLSHAYTKAIEWGLCEDHPIKGKVGKLRTPPRTRYIEDWELEEALKVASPFLKAYIRLKLLTGLRRSDLLSIQMSDITDEGIHVTPRKTAGSTGKSMIFVWSDGLREAVDEAIKIQKKSVSPWLFHTRTGDCYVKANGTANGFDSVWQRFMCRVLNETNVLERFTEHDIRAKVGSDASSSEEASSLLGHSSSSITERVYRRKVQRIDTKSFQSKK